MFHPPYILWSRQTFDSNYQLLWIVTICLDPIQSKATLTFNNAYSGSDSKSISSKWDELSDKINLKFRNKSINLTHAFCQLSRLRTLLLTATAERKPSKVFSKLLNWTAIAKKSGDVYMIYACKFVNATLLPHLRLANKGHSIIIQQMVNILPFEIWLCFDIL